jgi:hypothetical protein
MPAFEDETPNIEEESLRIPPSRDDFIQALKSPTPRNVPMEEHIHAREFVIEYKLNDVGTRYDHYSEILALWEDTVDLMARRRFLGRDELVKKMGLELAITQLKKSIAGMGGYGDQVDSIRKLINGVPTKASLIFGGRGTTLNRTGYDGGTT